MASEFKFLEERPLQTAEELSGSKFGHEEIANTLVKIVKKSPAPFTIGLFAKWGSGKSTVANALKAELPKEDIPVVLFDVWKHEGDALRRTFLNETVSQLKDYGSKFFDQSFTLDDRITQSVSRNTESKIKFREKIWGQIWPPLCLGLIVAIVTGFLADSFGMFDKYLNFIFGIAGVTSGGGLLVWLVKNSVHLFTKETVTHAVDKFQDPHEFEQEFGNILNALKQKRVLIVFDNLDRVMHNKVAEVLSTIKTFLEPQDIANVGKEVVFLVPCDANAIKKHLSSLYNKNGETGDGVFDPDEFLRKFFNTIVWIPDFILSELEAFARDRLKETKIALLDDDYVAWIITKAFRDNPRQVVQFVNILLANYLLIEERQGDGKDFPEDFLKENTPQLTKYLILNQLFPEEMDMLREHKATSLKETRLREDTEKEFIKFINETDDIEINDLRAFFTLRRSEQEKKFPGFEAFIAALQDGEIDKASELVEQFGDFSEPGLVDDFSQAIKAELQKTSNPVSRINLVGTLLSLLQSVPISLNDTLFEEVNNILKGSAKEHLHTVDPDVLNDVLLPRKPSYRTAVVDQWVVLLDDLATGKNKYKIEHELFISIFKIISSHPNYLNSTNTEKIRKFLTENRPRDLELADLVTQSKESKQKFVTKEYVQSFVAAIAGSNNFEQMEHSLKIVNIFNDDLLKHHGGEAIIKKFIELVTSLNQNTKIEDYPEKAGVLEQIRKFMSDHKVIAETAEVTTRDSLGDILVTGFNAPADHKLRSMFIPVLYGVKELLSDPKWSQIENHISAWVGNVEVDNLVETANALPKEVRASFYESPVLFKALTTRSISHPDFRNTILPELTEEQKADLLQRFFDTNIDSALDYLESLDVDQSEFLFLIVDHIWSKFNSGNPAQKARIFALLNKHGSDIDQSVKEQLANKITVCLTGDHNMQAVGETALRESNLPKELKNKIATEVSTWLRTSGVSVDNQKTTIESIVQLHGSLTDQEKKDLAGYLLSKIILQSNNVPLLSSSFNLIAKIGVKYDEHSETFDAIKNRIDTGVGEDVKDGIFDGLRMLKPSRTSKTNRDFWGWVTGVKDSE